MGSYHRPEIFYAWEDSGLICLAHVLGYNGATFGQSAINAVSYQVFDRDNSNTLTASGTPAVANVIFDTAQDDATWPYDDGYNFRCVIPAASFPTGGHRYRVEFILDPSAAGEEDFPIVFDIHCGDLIGS